MFEHRFPKCEQEGLQLARDARLPRHICDLQYNLANTYLAMNDLDAARNALCESLTLAQRLDSSPQKVEAVSSAIAYFQCLGLHKQAAQWAGSISDNPILDQPLFESTCREIEVSLGDETFKRSLMQGKARSLDDVVTQILTDE